jgi:uncharacterized membrane protein YraQ (UPF0718 family)
VTALTARRAHAPFWLGVAAAAVLWVVAWFAALPVSMWLAFEVLGLEPGTQLGEAVAFFLYDVPKILLLLTGIVTGVSFLRSFVSPEKVRSALAGRNAVVGTVAAAAFGIITPFCSCSAVSLFIGFLEAGVPLGVTFAFLVASPMVNEVAIVLLWGLLGPQLTIAYVIAGLVVAVFAGLIIGRLGMERHVEDYVWKIRAGSVTTVERPTLEDRVRDAWRSTRDIVGRIWKWVLIGIGVGAIIHGFVPTELVVRIGGEDNPLAVPALVALGVPLYSNAAGTVPIIEALLGKGLPVGSALAFMMAITALSLPEMMILRKVMKTRLLATFVAIVSVGIIVIGYAFNWLT